MWLPDELETVACDLCHRHTSRPLHVRPDGLTVVQCPDCGLAYLNPRPGPQFIRRLYQASYFESIPPPELQPQPRLSHSCPPPLPATGYLDYTSPPAQLALLRAAEAKLEFLMNFWTPQARRCLEVGCATGEFCASLARQHAYATGIDISSFAIDLARQRYPAPAFLHGDLNSLSVDEKFDALFAFEVIEHVTSPLAFLQQARLRLQPGGLLFLSTPNLDCARAVGFSQWVGFQTSLEHLFFLDAKTLHSLSALADLKLLWVFSGGGNGLRRTFQNEPWKHSLRRLLAAIGLLDWTRSLRAKRSRPASPFSASASGHTLLAVLAKPAIPS
jgi:SAM-dependent methyltransferase